MIQLAVLNRKILSQTLAIHQKSSVQAYEFVEIFCGKAWVSRVMRCSGHTTAQMDILMSDADQLSSPQNPMDLLTPQAINDAYNKGTTAEKRDILNRYLADKTFSWKSQKTNLKDAHGFLSKAHKFRADIAAEDKAAMREGNRVLQEALEAAEDLMNAAEHSEDGHQQLLQWNTHLSATVKAYQELLFEVLLKAKPDQESNPK